MAERIDVNSGLSPPAAQEHQDNPHEIPYEDIRRENIKRNDKFLRDLGLCATPQQTASKRSIYSVDKLDADAASTLLQMSADRRDVKRCVRNSNEDRMLDRDGAHTAATYSVGQLVWAQHQNYGEIWWPATVIQLRGENSVDVTWEQPDQTETSSEIHVSKLRGRLLCKCGNCSAESLVNEDALLEHNRRVSNCINFETKMDQFQEVQMAESRYERESRDLIYFNFQ
jgi:hypothetical protein